ncbi:hypothetical protein DCAR_0622923 [Daucus carota subsp. sativus]|uniref:Uncharacterized protein n=1 Tax=Daucus carota subsp. sativus TaxID=79200 RepID=A0A164UYF8_DAUCS|nr:hypothetical protein DCAR_0622923 [Daucus carota subsp. sativus]
MNFLKVLISKTLEERENLLQAFSGLQVDPSSENGHQGALQPCHEVNAEGDEVKEKLFIVENPHSEIVSDINQVSYISDEDYFSYTAASEDSVGGGYGDTLSCN